LNGFASQPNRLGIGLISQVKTIQLIVPRLPSCSKSH
jgi:hypothetical protein